MRRRASPVKRKTKKTPAPADARLAPEEVSSLLDEVQAEERNEKVWKEMTAGEADEADGLAKVEEKFVGQPHERDHKLRRWKFFGK